MSFKPGDPVAHERSPEDVDFISSAFDASPPFGKMGQVMAVIDGAVYVWWDGEPALPWKRHEPSELRHVSYT